MRHLQEAVEQGFNEKDHLEDHPNFIDIKEAVDETIDLLDMGEIRVAEKKDGQWTTHEWVKKAILLKFKLSNNQTFSGQFTQFYDKIPLKYANHTPEEFSKIGVRIVPPACIRSGSFIEPNTVLMPCYINIGAYIGSGSMIDTWATVGSAVQIGKNVHLSGGAGLGGVLEPLQANPTIIEDNCFIGARSEIVEGVIVEENSVISMGVYIGQSTPIYNRLTDEIIYGRVPAGSVVVPGSLPSKDGKYNKYAAIIMKQVDEKTRSKIPLNELLREE